MTNWATICNNFRRNININGGTHGIPEKYDVSFLEPKALGDAKGHFLRLSSALQKILFQLDPTNPHYELDLTSNSLPTTMVTEIAGPLSIILQQSYLNAENPNLFYNVLETAIDQKGHAAYAARTLKDQLRAELFTKAVANPDLLQILSENISPSADFSALESVTFDGKAWDAAKAESLGKKGQSFWNAPLRECPLPIEPQTDIGKAALTLYLKNRRNDNLAAHGALLSITSEMSEQEVTTALLTAVTDTIKLSVENEAETFFESSALETLITTYIMQPDFALLKIGLAQRTLEITNVIDLALNDIEQARATDAQIQEQNMSDFGGIVTEICGMNKILSRVSRQSRISTEQIDLIKANAQQMLTFIANMENRTPKTGTVNQDIAYIREVSQALSMIAATILNEQQPDFSTVAGLLTGGQTSAGASR